MITCTRRLQFCAGHRVHNHEGKCANMHGHNYVVYLTAQAGDLDSLGRVIDFSVLKEAFESWIDFHWDHGFIFFDQDSDVYRALLDMCSKRWAAPFNPTAENMAEFLLRKVGPLVLEGTGVKLVRVVLWETENCFAEACL